MKALVVSYSLTGNNERLAQGLAAGLAAEHVRIEEPGKRTMATIAFDVMFNRTPKARMPEVKTEHDLVVFVGPVWLGHVAAPFRAWFKQLGPRIGKYAYVSISGGADGPNPNLAPELTKRLGKAPAVLIDMHKADLLPPDPKPTRNDTMAYQLTDDNVKHLTETALAGLARVTATGTGS